jgi:hypothetical protein
LIVHHAGNFRISVSAKQQKDKFVVVAREAAGAKPDAGARPTAGAKHANTAKPPATADKPVAAAKPPPVAQPAAIAQPAVVAITSDDEGAVKISTINVVVIFDDTLQNLTMAHHFLLKDTMLLW